MLIEDCMEKFKEDYSRRLALTTINDYVAAVGQLITYSGKSLDTINAKEIRQWLVHLEKKGLKSTSINKMLSALKLFFTYCLEENWITRNPMSTVSFLAKEQWVPYYLEHHQLMQLRQLVEGNVRERAIVELLYVTGIRLGELVALKQEDINWSECMIYIKEGKGKKDRLVLFTQSCSEYLKAYLAQRQDDLPSLFVTTARGIRPLGRRGIQWYFAGFTKQLGYRITPHTMRHTFAAHLAMKGMPLACIQALLGHDDPQTAQAYAQLYDHARKQMYDEWM